MRQHAFVGLGTDEKQSDMRCRARGVLPNITTLTSGASRLWTLKLTTFGESSGQRDQESTSEWLGVWGTGRIHLRQVVQPSGHPEFSHWYAPAMLSTLAQPTNAWQI